MKPTGTRHDTLSQFCNEFGIVGAVSDSLQIFHQIVLLRAAEIEVELCVVVVHHIRQCRNPSVVETRTTMDRADPLQPSVRACRSEVTRPLGLSIARR